MTDFVKLSGRQLIKTLEDTLAQEDRLILEMALGISDVLRSGRKMLLCGNGGSAADCQHLAAEFVNRFRKERRPLPAVALTTDTSILTAIANDYSFGEVFEKQVQALGEPGDALLAISTSGRSENVLRALSAARKQEMLTIGFTGRDGRKMKALCDYLFCVQSTDTPRIQEVHIFAGHLICDLVEQKVFKR